MTAWKNLFATRWGIIGVGLVIGVLAALLQKWGNPGNMGICVACFERDIAGGLGLHRAPVVQYVRPEIIGFVLGALVSAYLFQEFRPRAGSAPIVRFVLGAIAMIGALVFLGCPWRALLRLAGGDGNAIFGLLGLVTGVWVGTWFFKQGYNLGRTQVTYSSVGYILPLLMVGLLLLRLIFPSIPEQAESGILFYSLKGPGAKYAPVIVSLAVGLLIGLICQRSRFCTMGAFRDLILFRQAHLFSGVLALLAAAWVTNLIVGQFHPGFVNQPVAHTMGIWNFGGMVVAGLAFALAGAIGPATLAAVTKYDPTWLAQKYLWRRLKYYANDIALGLRQKYLSGWVNRCIKVEDDVNPRPGSITTSPLPQEKLSYAPILAKVNLIRDAADEIVDVLENSD